MVRMGTITVLAAAFAGMLPAQRAGAQQTGGTARSPATQPSPYNEEQAARGELVYQNGCIDCHELLQYTGPAFRLKWNGRSVFDLYDVLRSTMPDKNPGMLPQQDYIDVLGYMLKLNGVPSGKTALPLVDSLLKKVKLDLPAQQH